jgi:hypothetical protein
MSECDPVGDAGTAKKLRIVRVSEYYQDLFPGFPAFGILLKRV